MSRTKPTAALAVTPDQRRSTGVAVPNEDRPVVVLGAHGQSLFMHVAAVPREGETVIGNGYAETNDGGKATNQAVAAARLGVPVRLVSLVGRDERGRRILLYLDSQRVDRRWVQTTEGATDVGFVMLSPTGVPAIASAQDLSRRVDDRFVLDAADAMRGASVVVCQLEAPVSCALAAFTQARASGAITILNPAPAVPMPVELIELTDVLVPNQHEAREMVGRDAPVGELAERLAAAAPWSRVVVTAGAEGAYLARAGERSMYIPAPSVAAVDTTGAGDAFVGALAARLRDGIDLSAAVAFAVNAAAVSVTRPGTMDTFASLAEVLAFQPVGASEL